MAVRSEREITKALDSLDPEAAAGGQTQWPAMSYEQGVDAALRWAAGLTDDHPVDDD